MILFLLFSLSDWKTTKQQHSSINPRAQIFLFSATFPERVVKFAEAVAPGAAWIRVKPDDLTLDNIHQFSMAAPDESAKFNLLADLYSLMDVGQSIIFVHVYHFMWAVNFGWLWHLTWI